MMRPPDGKSQLQCVMAVAVNLLARNYSLSREHYRVLLIRRVDDDANQLMWDSIYGAALTAGPKLSDDTSDSVSS